MTSGSARTRRAIVRSRSTTIIITTITIMATTVAVAARLAACRCSYRDWSDRRSAIGRTVSRFGTAMLGYARACRSANKTYDAPHTLDKARTGRAPVLAVWAAGAAVNK